MAQYPFFQTIDTNIYLYGGHLQQNRVSNWHYPREKHQLFELIVVLQGQATSFLGPHKLDLHTGDALIITPETWHESFNFCGAQLQFFCVHFNIGDLALKTRVIQELGNTALRPATPVAHAAQTFAHTTIRLAATALPPTERKLKTEIAFLNFILALSHNRAVLTEQPQLPEHDVLLAQQLASHLFVGSRPVAFRTVCARLNLSTTYGHRVFKRVYGITPHHYVQERRFSQAKALLNIGENSIATVAQKTHFNSQASFSKQFKKWSGLTPSAFRQTTQAHQQTADYLHPQTPGKPVDEPTGPGASRRDP